MRTRHYANLAVWAATLLTGFTLVVRAAPQGTGAVVLDPDDIGGVVSGPNGPEAGVWVIAETTDLPTRFSRTVVTDDAGRYVVPDLPAASYQVWVRGYGLVDSPAGQAAWILEKFWAWTDSDGHPENVLTRDELLDNIMLYWLPGTGASSARLYWESFNRRGGGPIQVPVGASIFPREIFRASRRWAEKVYPKIIHWNELDKGGHFAAFEQPETYVNEVRTCFRSVR